MRAFTGNFKGIVRIITIPIEIYVPGSTSNYINTMGIIDTGASLSVISKEIAQKLNIFPSGKIFINSASAQNVPTNTYLVDININNNYRVPNLEVAEGQLVSGAECLIGMDILSLGDFAISNFQGNTCVTFRVPSMKKYDFIQEMEDSKPKNIIKNNKLPSRNKPCPCGSKKLYKQCCGYNNN